MLNKFSIITVVKNDCNNILSTITSCVNQSYANKEIIVIDGLSTDGTSDLISTNLVGIDMYIREYDRGIYDAMNKGVELATGDYIIFMNSGDQFYQNNVLNKISQYDLKENDLICGSWIEEDSNEVNKPRNSIKYSMPTSHQAMLFNTKLIKKYKFSEEYKIGADYNLVCDLVNKGDAALKIIDETISIVKSGGFGRNVSLYEADYKKIVFMQFGLFAFLKYNIYKLYICFWENNKKHIVRHKRYNEKS